MPMFDIEDSKDIELKNNKTSRETLARVTNVEGLRAKDNEAGVEQEVRKAEEDVVELKPNFIGLGINLRALWRKIRGKEI